MDGAGIKPLTSQLRDHNCTTEPLPPISNSGMAVAGEESGEPRRVVILGKTGYGKSSLANTIFGETLFKVNHSSTSQTSQCQAETRSVNGRRFTLIDTPGFFDTRWFDNNLHPEIIKCVTECASGLHAFIILLKVEKYTQHEQAVITQIKETFSEEAFKYATVVFTHGDQLEEGQTIEDFVGQDEKLRELVKKCGGRCHVIDNKYWKEKPRGQYRSNTDQVDQLLQTINKMIEDNNDGCYTNEMLQAVEEKIQQERESIRQSMKNMSEEEINERAKNNVSKKLLITLAGIGTGALIGAFLGVKILMKAVLKALKEGGHLIKTLGKDEKAVAAALATAVVGAGATAASASAAGGATAAAAAAAVELTAVSAAAAGGATAAAELTAVSAVAAGGATAAAAAAASAAGGATAAAELTAVSAVAAGGATAAAAVGGTVAAVVGVSALIGACAGGYQGLKATEKAETVQEAFKMSKKAVIERGERICDKIDHFGGR